MRQVKDLLARGANPDIRSNTTLVRGFMQLTGSWVNFDGPTPFVRAALAGDITVMRLLLGHGADAIMISLLQELMKPKGPASRSEN